jgi:hypothetical protein
MYVENDCIPLSLLHNRLLHGALCLVLTQSGHKTDISHPYNVRYIAVLGTAVAQWLRYCATNRKVTGSIPDGVIGIFHRNNPSDRTMALGSTQPLQEILPGAFPGGKGGRCVRLTTLPPSCAVVM